MQPTSNPSDFGPCRDAEHLLCSEEDVDKLDIALRAVSRALDDALTLLIALADDTLARCAAYSPACPALPASFRFRDARCHIRSGISQKPPRAFAVGGWDQGRRTGDAIPAAPGGAAGGAERRGVRTRDADAGTRLSAEPRAGRACL